MNRTESTRWKCWRNTRYFISENGEVYSTIKNKKISPLTDKANSICYDFVIDGKIKRLVIHNIVAELYLPPPLSKNFLIKHKDGNRSNNNYKNLTYTYGVLDHNSLFDIRCNPRFKKGTDLAREYGVTKKTIYNIRHKRRLY